MTARIISLALCLGWSAIAQQPQTAPTPRPASRVHKSKRSSSATAQAAPASAPAEASIPPQVVYENGLLTIKAQNSTLRDILDLIHARTGATITAPVDLGQKIVTQLGPASPGKVIGDLLDQAGFDYMILGAPGNANAITEIRVQLRPKETVETGTRAPAEPPASALPTPQETVKPEQSDEGAKNNEDPPPPKEENGAQAPTPQPQQPQPSQKPPDPNL